MLADFSPYVIVVWMLVMIGFFPSLPPRRSILVIALSGTLFLPESVRREVAFGPFHFSKIHAISYAGVIAAMLFDAKRVAAFMPRLIDAPMLIWCLIPLPSVLTNDPPPDGSSMIRDALSQTWSNTVGWGFPYFLGRLYFSERASFSDLALGVIVAATAYMPLCWFEIRMSPQLHTMVYGYSQHSFAQSIRFGGYRPMVFMQHGLAVGLFMAMATLQAVWLWRSGSFTVGAVDRRLTPYLFFSTILLVPTVILIKSTGAIILGIAGFTCLWASRSLRSPALLVLLTLLPVLYAGARTTGLWSGMDLVRWSETHVSADRAESLAFRLKNEDLLIEKALQRPGFGWGGWGRNRQYNEEGKDQTVADGLWIMVLGERGLAGLLAFGGAFLLPVIRFTRICPAKEWGGREWAPAAVCAFVLALWVVDQLFNAMMNPIYLLIAGGLAGLTKTLKTA